MRPSSPLGVISSSTSLSSHSESSASVATHNHAAPSSTISKFLANVDLGQPGQILIVDDDKVDRLTVKRCLDEIYEVTEAYSLAQCKEIVSSEKFLAIFLDYRLPDGVGPEHIDEIRALTGDQELPIIVLTGIGSEETAVESFKDGASDYISKDNISSASLRRALHHTTQKASLKRHLNDQRQSLIIANDQLRRQNHEIQSFYQTVSHELKTPLTAAREYASLVHDGVVGPVSEEQRDLLNRAINCCDSLKVLVDDLLDAAQFEKGSIKLKLCKSPIQAIINNAIDCVLQLPQNSELTVDTNFEGKFDDLNVDSQRITQVLINLLNNACKFTEGPCDVKIVASLKHTHEENYVQISVEDNGPGIKPEYQQRIFEKFYQLGCNHESKNVGMGLGLFLCKKILDAHNGSIFLDPSFYSGSRFILRLPISQN